MSTESQIIELVKTLFFTSRDGDFGLNRLTIDDPPSIIYECNCGMEHSVDMTAGGEEEETSVHELIEHADDCELGQLHKLISEYKKPSIADRLRQLASEASPELASAITFAVTTNGQSQVESISIAADLAAEKGE